MPYSTTGSPPQRQSRCCEIFKPSVPISSVMFLCIKPTNSYVHLCNKHFPFLSLQQGQQEQPWPRRRAVGTAAGSPYTRAAGRCCCQHQARACSCYIPSQTCSARQRKFYSCKPRFLSPPPAAFSFLASQSLMLGTKSVLTPLRSSNLR